MVITHESAHNNLLYDQITHNAGKVYGSINWCAAYLMSCMREQRAFGSTTSKFVAIQQNCQVLSFCETSTNRLPIECGLLPRFCPY